MKTLLASLQNLRKLAKAAPKVNADQGVMVAFELDRRIAKKLKVSGGVTLAQMHCTFVYVGKVSALDKRAVTKLPDAVRKWAEGRKQIPITIAGIGRFSGGPDGDPVIALVDSPRLTAERPSLVKALREAGVNPKENHGYTAHVTLSYVKPEEPTPVTRIGPIETKFTAVHLHVAGKVTKFDLS